jgi:predicted HicB family RNase H-like nuclease
MSDVADYRISVQKRSTEDGLMFEGTVAEFPDVAVYCETANEAYSEVLEVITGLAEQYAELGRAMPSPISRREEYSGKFIVRLSRSLHRELCETAEIEGVSLNQYVVTVLSAHSQRGSLVTVNDFPVINIGTISPVSYASEVSATDIAQSADRPITGGGTKPLKLKVVK